MLLIDDGRGGRIRFDRGDGFMARNSMNDRKAFGVNGPQAHELTESELDSVWGRVNYKIG
jgi:hypothetical protein